VPATASGYPPVPRLSPFPHRRLGSSLQCASNASPSPPKIPTGQPVIRLQFPRHRHLIPARRCRRWGIPPPNPRRRGRAILPPFPVASPPRQGLLPPFPAPPPPGQGLLPPFPAPPPPGQGVPPPFPASVSLPPTPSNSCRRGRRLVIVAVAGRRSLLLGRTPIQEPVQLLKFSNFIFV
jgi:hypothetical protein